MKLIAVEITGLRSIDRAHIPLSPVTFFTGPNGIGKTAAVGAVAYALTGRFPGLQAVHPAELLALALDRSKGFQVRVETDTGTIVERGVRVGDRVENHLVVVHGRRSRGIEDAKGLLLQAFGDVSWFVDAFDPERSIWRLSGEKRKEWALNLCAGSSGWSRDRLARELGPASEDWDPTLGRDAAACLELNLDRLHDRLLGLQKLAREAKTVADGVTVGDDVSIVERKVADVEAKYEAARQTLADAERLLSNTRADQANIDAVRRDRARLTDAIAAARTDLAQLLPPAPPVLNSDVARLATLEAERFALQLELDGADGDLEAAAADQAAAGEALRRAEADVDQIDQTHACPVCGTDQPDPSMARRRVEVTRQRLDGALKRWLDSTAQVDRCRTEADRLDTTITSLHTARELYHHDVASFDARKQAFESTWQTILRNVQSLEEQLGKLPAERTDLVVETLQRDVDKARDAVNQFKTELAQARADYGVAKERAGQRRSANEAKERIVAIQALGVKMRAVRDRMLDDAVKPLSEALLRLRALAPAGGVWGILRQEKTIDIVLARLDADPLPVTSLSAGEKMRGTLALLIARSVVRREPWVGLFVDNFEQIHPVVERADVLRALVAAANSGFVDNALVAGACDPLPPLLDVDGMHTYVGGGGAVNERTGT